MSTGDFLAAVVIALLLSLVVHWFQNKPTEDTIDQNQAWVESVADQCKSGMTITITRSVEGLVPSTSYSCSWTEE